MTDVAIALLVAFGLALGFAGVVLPSVPGLSLMWLSALGYGIAHGFGDEGKVIFGIITALTIAGTAAGFTLPTRAAGEAGAARSSILFGVVLAIVGFFVVPVVGLPLGGVLGIYLAERHRTGDGAFAQRATVATLKGFGMGVLAQWAAGFVIVVAWLIWLVL